MDDLEEVWGPRGRATVDPGSIRPVAPARPAAGEPPVTSAPPLVPPVPRVPAVPAVPPVAGSASAPVGEIVPVSTTSSGSRPQPLVWIAAGAAALVAAVLVLALVARSATEPPAPVVATGSTATTIVSAAADLLGRSRTTAVPTDATTSTAAPDSTVVSAPAAPSTVPPASTVPTVTPATPAPTTAAPSSAGLPPLALAEDTARRFIDVVSRRDCDGLWNLLSRGTQSFLTGSAEPGEPSGRDALCEGLRSEETIPPMRVHGPAVAQGDRAAVPLESEGAVEDLHFVAEDGRWVIDLFGDFAEES